MVQVRVFAFGSFALAPSIIKCFHVARKCRFARLFVHEIVLFAYPPTQFLSRAGSDGCFGYIFLKVRGTPCARIKACQ